jgi:hypothetical protein
MKQPAALSSVVDSFLYKSREVSDIEMNGNNPYKPKSYLARLAAFFAGTCWLVSLRGPQLM